MCVGSPLDPPPFCVHCYSIHVSPITADYQDRGTPVAEDVVLEAIHAQPMLPAAVQQRPGLLA